ncbi:MAG: PD40 domain-containing protein [Verrucomicrobiae bacterium]|nr:PD40 domain-containing protein [Verrucomicrobiae bacterium]
MKDRQTGVVIRANTNAAGEESMGGDAMAMGFSFDGRYVLFSSTASNLVPDDTNGEVDLFLKDLQTGAISRVNTTAAGDQSLGNTEASITGKLTDDGRYVVFQSGATNLVGNDTNGNVDIFRKDLTTGEIVRVDTDSAGNQTANRPSGVNSSEPAISLDGRYVVFRSAAPDLVPDDSNGLDDVFLKDLVTGAISRVNTDANGGQASGGESGFASLSADGRYVVFSSRADNLVENDTNGTVDTFLKDMRTGLVARLTVNAAGEQSIGASEFGGKTFVRGTVAVFASDATNLLPDDTNGEFDLFRSDFSSLLTGFSTSVIVDDNGDLVITGSGSVANDLLLEVVNGRLEISDPNATIGGPIGGSVNVGNDGRKIGVDLAAFTGDIIVRMQGGDDTVTIGDLAGVAGGLRVEDGSGHDVVRHVGAVSLQGAGAFFVEAEEIRVESGSAINVEDGGIDLLANQGNSSAVKSVGLRITNSEINTTGSGNVNLRGNGGAVGSGNIGIVIDQTSVATGGGRLVLAGNGGNGIHGNDGLRLGRGTGITVAGTGDFDIYGYGYGSGDRNRGIVIDGDVELRSADGRLLMSAWGAEGRSGNVGLFMDRATLINTGGFGTILRGMASGTGSNNTGVILNGTTVRDESGGELSVSGNGSAFSQGVENRAVELNSVSISATGGGLVRISGNGGSGTHRNEAIRIANSNISTESNSVRIVGNVSDDVTGNGNRGIFVSGSTIASGTDLTVTGRAGGGVNGNEGMRLLSSTFTATGEAELRGERSSTFTVSTSGAFNRGVFARSIEVSGGEVGLSGQGNAGTNRNEGLRLLGGTFTSTAGGVGLAGTASDAATGRDNLGAFIRGISINANARASINGQGGRGTSGNFGLYLDGATVMSQTSTAGFIGNAQDQTTGSRNYGAMVVNSNFTATTSFSAIGRGGGGVNGNSGMTIRGGSITSTADLNLFGSGRSWATGRGNFGVNLQGTELSTEGDVDINSIGGGGTHGNFATQLRRVEIASASGRVDVAGQGIDDPTGNGNFGMRIIASTIEAANILVDGKASSGANGNFGTFVAGGSMNSTNGFVVVAGSGNGLTTGSGNFGALVRNVTLSAIGDGVNVIGGGGGGISGNFGARVDGGSFSSDIGGVILRGSADGATTGAGNYGLRVSGANVNAGTNIEFQGIGGGGRSNNHGVQLVRVSGDAGSRLDVTGSAISATTGNNNQGALLIRNRLSSVGEATLTGTGGGGISGNAALRVIGGSFGSTLNGLMIAGEADANTAGRGNGGVFLLSRANLTGTSIEIDGTGGGGGGANFGTFIVGNVSAPNAVVTGSATDGVSEDEAGGFVP